MLRPLRPAAAALLPFALALTLAGCGDSASDSSDDSTSTSLPTPEANPDTGETASGLDAVSIGGEIGSVPELTWSAQMKADKVEPTTVIKGDGDALKKDDMVLANLVIANGFTKQTAFSTYDKGKGPETLTVGSDLGPLFATALDGAHVGDRIAVTSSAMEAFPGSLGQPELGIGNGDAVLAVVDVMSKITKGPTGEQQAAPAWTPKLTFTDKSVPSGFDFGAAPTPQGQFRKAILIKGTGPVVKTGQTLVVNYLGEVFDGTAPFDQSYGKEPYTKPLSIFIAGWKQGLPGVPVGSRVVLQVPPKLGYGEKGNAQAGIKGTDTMFFVIDILAAG